MPVIAIGVLRQVGLIAAAPAAVDWTQRRGVDEMANDSGRPLPHLPAVNGRRSQALAPSPAASAANIRAL